MLQNYYYYFVSPFNQSAQKLGIWKRRPRSFSAVQTQEHIYLGWMSITDVIKKIKMKTFIYKHYLLIINKNNEIFNYMFLPLHMQ